MAKEEGVILALGKAVNYDVEDGIRDDLKVGDIIAFARYGGKQLVKEDEDGNEIRVMRDIDVLAIKEEEK